MRRPDLDHLTVPALPVSLPSRESLQASLDQLPALGDLPASLPARSSLPAAPKVPEWVPITPFQAKVALLSIRSLIGVLGWLFPNLSGRLFGIDPAQNPAAPYLGRLFAARELALVAPLLVEDEDVQRRSLQVGMAVDAADAAASVAAGVTGTLPKRAALLTGVTAVIALLLGWIATSDD
ncbi:MAG: hypothetical protein H6518_12035 [Microthrixaceae bacterium]|nr:hypothetical protein [Microthrixaceae bacterium]